MMDFYINFKLDEEFTETVQSPVHDKFTYSSFSEGEKMRIDLALLFAWREVARFKNSANTNLLILDEVFDSSLDSVGTEEFNKIIPITGLIMTKLDGTAKGGSLLAVAKKYKLPVIALGLGEKEDDLQIFEAEKFAEAFTQIN